MSDAEDTSPQTDNTEEELCNQAVSPDMTDRAHSLIAECLGNEMFALRKFLVPRLKEIDDLLIDSPSSYSNELTPFDLYQVHIRTIRDTIGQSNYGETLSRMRAIAGYKCSIGVSEKTRAAMARHYEQNRRAVSDEEAESTSKWSRKRKLFALARTTVVEEKIQQTASALLRVLDTIARGRQEVLGPDTVKMITDLFVPSSR